MALHVGFDYRISLAAAGFGMDDITVTAEQNALTIEGRKPDGKAREYLYQGIAARPEAAPDPDRKRRRFVIAFRAEEGSPTLG